jgi:competence protein ComEC
MLGILLFFSLGIIATGYLPDLPSPAFFLAILLALLPAIFLIKKFPVIKLVLSFVVGVAYGVFSGYQFLSNQLVDDLVARDIFIEGKVVDLPEEDSRRQAFDILVTNAYDINDYSELADSNNKTPVSFESFPKKIRLSSFGDVRVKTGEHWRLLVKLKKPRGFVNPGGFDYQVSMLRRSLGAQGYLRVSAHNKLIQPQPNFSMDVLRYRLQQWLLNKSQSAEKGILVALLVGDTSLVEKQRWDEMQKTGTNHLIAISGLHLGFFAIVGFFMGNFLGRFLQLMWRACPSMLIGYCFSISFALFYSVIAGLNIPTLRTLIMLAVVQWACIWRRSFRGADSLLFALVLVLLYDPLAAYDIGFWLSFGAVGMLIFCFSGRYVLPAHSQQLLSSKKTLASKKILYWSTHFYEFVKSQWVMFIGLLVPLAIFVHSSALLAPPANFVAIPLVTFFVVPCLILAAVCHLASSSYFDLVSCEDFFLTLAELGLHWLHQWLQCLLELGHEKLNPLVNFNVWAIPIALMSVFLILLPRGVGNKILGIIGLLFAFIIPLKSVPELQMLVFDVGQGTAILLRTPHHQLLYDTGPLYTDQFDAGSALVAPYLQSQGLKYADTLILSHNDRDHAGGVAGILSSIQVGDLLLGEPESFHLLEKNYSDKAHLAKVLSQKKSCHEQLPWQWDQVTFRFLSWPILPSAKANNRSCVLLVEYQGHKILLTGDIEKEVERSLLAQNNIEQVEILLAPHHGSRTSSTQSFVEHTKPKRVIYSAGFRNQHGHPHRDIQARYKLVGAQQLNTATNGALEFSWGEQGASRVRAYREFSKRYWFDNNLN